MSFKSIAMGIMERESEKFLEGALQENGYEIKAWRDIEFINFEMLEKYGNGFMYEINFKVRAVPHMPIYKTLQVGGTISENGYCFPSVIRDEKNPVLWMSSEEARKSLAIDKIVL